MKRSNLVTSVQAKKLKELGFKEKVCHYQLANLKIGAAEPRNWNDAAVPYGIDNIVNYPYLSVPTLDEALNWLLNRIKKHYWYYHVYTDKTISISLVNNIHPETIEVLNAKKILSISLDKVRSKNYYLEKSANLNVEKRSIITKLIKFIKNDEKI